ncbi:MAG: Na/Pi cotransporter family protein [Gammaproteobacteria bacterium]|jgi:phosphate:Na+ symporter|nr:Na/Pi cotransporter family protein [Gammaproteobacteria bacterium]
MYSSLRLACLNLSVSRFLLLALAVLTVFSVAPAYADSAAESGINWWNMGMTLFGGLALFLFGMEQMADALKAVAGERMKVILAKLTTNRFMGAATGAFVTAIIQSSSVTTVLVVGFITAGLMSMSQSIGVIMGANIGTTITAQIVAFKVTKAALLMVAVGFGMLFFSKQEKIKQYGGMLMGLGLVFFGMSVMSDAMSPLRSYQPFLDLMATMENPLIGILVAAVFTGLIQSSSATTGIVIVMATQGFITLQAGIALAFGANIGTCVTAMLASIGKPREAVRAATVHVLFNVFGVVLWVGLIPQLAEFVTWLSPAHPELTGTDRLASEAPRQIANAHTIFNVANTIIFIGFTSQFARLVEKLVPDKPIEELIIAKPKYLDEELLETPSLALDRARLEIGNMGSRVRAMLEGILPAVINGDRAMLKNIAKIDDEVDILHGHIVTYLGRISQKALTEQQTRALIKLMGASNDLENIGDIIETDMVYLGNEGIDEHVTISKETREMLRKLHDVIMSTAELAIDAVMENDQQAAQEVIALKADINRLMESAAMHESRRLVAAEPNRLAAYTLEIDIIEKLKRIYYFSKRMAKSVMPEELSESAA